MAEWRKIIVSGSQAELAGVTGSFTGSFIGDGSGLSGVSSFSVSGDTNNRVITADGSGGGVGEANLTFDGDTLTVTGGITATIGTGTDNSVVVKNSSNELVTDEIDSKVWDGNLVDKQGTPVQYQVATFNDSDTLVASSNFTFNDSTLSVTGTVDVSSAITGSNLMLDGTLADGAGETTVLVIDATGNVKSDEIDPRVWGSTLVSGSLDDTTGIAVNVDGSLQTYPGLTFADKILTAPTASITGHLTVGGDLIVNGDLSYLNTTNTAVEDQFILLGSGSGTSADIGIIFDGVGGTTGIGAAFFYDGDLNRLSYATTAPHTATAVEPDAYIPLVFDVTGAAHTAVADVGNIKIEDDEAYIFV